MKQLSLYFNSFLISLNYLLLYFFQDEKDRQSKEIEQIQAKIRDTKRQIDEKHTEMTDLRERIDNDKVCAYVHANHYYLSPILFLQQRSNTLGEKLSKLQIKLKGVEMDIDAEHKKIAEFTLKLKSFDIETASLDSFMEFVVFAMNTMNEIEDCWSKLRLFFARIDNFVSKINELDFEQFRDVLDDNDRVSR
jgi:chromosome segregation ATPase